MSETSYGMDLICLVADGNMRQAVLGLLSRPRSLGCRPIQEKGLQVFVHPEHDPGCFHRSVEFLRPWTGRAHHALVLFDHQGSGQEHASREALEAQLEKRLGRSGWGDRAAVVVIDPELEVWLWSRSPHVEEQLGWSGASPSLDTWLADSGFLPPEALKPAPPKEALEEALRLARRPRSSSIYRALAERVSTKRCSDHAFLKLKATLAGWFPASVS